MPPRPLPALALVAPLLAALWDVSAASIVFTPAAAATTPQALQPLKALPPPAPSTPPTPPAQDAFAARGPVAATVVSAAVRQAQPASVLGPTVVDGGHWYGAGGGLRHLLAGLTLTAIVKALCIFGNVLWQVSPWPQVFRWQIRGCTGETDAAPYVSIAFGGWQWCSYGALAYFLTKRSGFLILVHANMLGAVLGTWYVMAFVRNCRHEGHFRSLCRYLAAVLTAVLLQVASLLLLPSVRALFFVGAVSSLCSFCGAFSVMVTVPQVIRIKDSRSIPGPVVLAGFLCSSAWVACGILLSDPLVTGPNAAATLACGFCVYLKQIYPSSACLEDDDVAEAGGVCAGQPSEFTPLERAARLAASKSKAMLHTKGDRAHSWKAEGGLGEPDFGETGGTF